MAEPSIPPARAAELQDIVDDVSGLLGAPTTLEDTAFALIAYSSQGGVAVDPVRAASILGKTATAEVRDWFEKHGIATASGPVHVPADPEQGIAARSCLPARSEGVTHGYLWVLEPATGFDPARLARAESLVRRAGELLALRRRGVDEHQRLVEDLLSGDETAATAARAALVARGELVAERPIAVVVVRAPAGGSAPGGSPSGGSISAGSVAGGSVSAGAVPGGSLPGGPVLGGSLPGGSVLGGSLPGGSGLAGSALGRSVLVSEFVTAADDPIDAADPLGPAGRRAARLVGALGRAGIGTPRYRVQELAAARHEADCAARVALARPQLGSVIGWAELGFYRLAGQGPAAIEALVAGTPAGRLRSRADTELVRTALVYLDQAGHAARTAAVLSVHRQTLYYRLEKIEQICGIDLDQGEPRLQLHLGLALTEILPFLR